jgi:hypothetical protein
MLIHGMLYVMNFAVNVATNINVAEKIIYKVLAMWLVKQDGINWHLLELQKVPCRLCQFIPQGHFYGIYFASNVQLFIDTADLVAYCIRAYLELISDFTIV